MASRGREIFERRRKNIRDRFLLNWAYSSVVERVHGMDEARVRFSLGPLYKLIKNQMGFFKDLLLKKMLKSQLKGVPEDQQEKIIQAVEKNPKLFSDIAAEVQEKIKGGMDQQSATMQVMMSHRAELQELMK